MWSNQTMHTGILIRNRRLERGLTLVELSDRAGVNYNQLTKYERGVHVPTAPVLKRIALAMRTPMEQLVP